MNVVIPPDGVPDVKWNKIPTQDSLGYFFILKQLLFIVSSCHDINIDYMKPQFENKQMKIIQEVHYNNKCFEKVKLL